MMLAWALKLDENVDVLNRCVVGVVRDVVMRIVVVNREALQR